MNIASIIQRNRVSFPNCPSIVFEGRVYTWKETAQRIECLAAGLASVGVRAGSRVAALAENSNSYLEILFAGPWIGAIPVPLNHRLSDVELSGILEDCGAAAMVVDAASWERTGRILGLLENPPRLIWAGSEEAPEGVAGCEALIGRAEIAQPIACAQTDTVGIFYTGGTTGRPKGVMLTHQNLWSSSLSYCTVMQLSPESVSLCSSPLFHVAAISAAMPALLAGGGVVVLPRFDAAGVMDAIAEHNVSVANFVPSMLRMLLDQPASVRERMKSLRTLIYGAAPAPPALLDELQDTFPDLRVCHAYGMTELTGCISILPPQFSTLSKRSEGRWKSAGQSIPGAELKIADADGKAVAAGVVGEVCARGLMVMAGYWNQPEATSQALRDGWMHTGDAGYMDEEGFVFIVDRFKDMIISGGENVYSAEVEAVLSRIPEVHQCAVFGVPHPKWGESVHAVIVPKPGASLNEPDVIRACRENLGGYKVPRSIEIRTSPLPLSGVNKVLKRALREEYLSSRQGVA